MHDVSCERKGDPPERAPVPPPPLRPLRPTKTGGGWGGVVGLLFKRWVTAERTLVMVTWLPPRQVPQRPACRKTLLVCVRPASVAGGVYGGLREMSASPDRIVRRQSPTSGGIEAEPVQSLDMCRLAGWVPTRGGN